MNANIIPTWQKDPLFAPVAEEPVDDACSAHADGYSDFNCLFGDGEANRINQRKIDG